MSSAAGSEGRCGEAAHAALRLLLDRIDGAELVAVSVRNAVALETETKRHRRGTLFWLTEGLVAVETPAGRFVAPPRSIGWMPPDMPHTVRSYGPTAGVGAFLVPDLCGDLPAEPANFPLSPLMALVLEKALHWPADQPLDSARKRLLLVLLDELRQTPAQPLQLPWPADARLLAIARALQQQPASGRTLAQWARWAGISPRTLSRRFVQETGMSFAQWRQWARLTRALEWLATGRAVKDVALSLGYTSVSAFIQAFRRTLGVTPAAYFRRLGAEPASMPPTAAAAAAAPARV